MHGLKKEAGAQLRELASDRGEALRALEGAKQAAEHRQHQLQATTHLFAAAPHVAAAVSSENDCAADHSFKAES